jgi:hypothetical protein
VHLLEHLRNQSQTQRTPALIRATSDARDGGDQPLHVRVLEREVLVRAQCLQHLFRATRVYSTQLDRIDFAQEAPDLSSARDYQPKARPHTRLVRRREAAHELFERRDVTRRVLHDLERIEDEQERPRTRPRLQAIEQPVDRGTEIPHQRTDLRDRVDVRACLHSARQLARFDANSEHLVGDLAELRADLQGHLHQQPDPVARAHRRAIEIEVGERIPSLFRGGVRVLEHEPGHQRRLPDAPKPPHRHGVPANEGQASNSPLHALEERLRFHHVHEPAQPLEVILATEEAVATRRTVSRLRGLPRHALEL